MILLYEEELLLIFITAIIMIVMIVLLILRLSLLEFLMDIVTTSDENILSLLSSYHCSNAVTFNFFIITIIIAISYRSNDLHLHRDNVKCEPSSPSLSPSQPFPPPLPTSQALFSKKISPP